MNLQKYCDDRAMSGYKSALLYYDPSDSNEKINNKFLYHLLIPLETAPTVSGSTDTFDFDLLTCPSKGQIEGKESLDQVDVDFLWHRDNVYRLERLQGKVLNFMVVYQDFTARAFIGTIKVRPQEAGADVMRGTFTITPMSAQTTTLYDARDSIADTVTFGNAIPSSLLMTTKTATIDVTTNPEDATITILADEQGVNDKITATYNEGKVTVTYSGEATKEYGLIYIKASKTGMASWVTTVAIEYNTEPAN